LLGALLIGALFYWKSCRNITEVVENTLDMVVAKIDSAVTSVVSSLKKTLSTGVELNFGENKYQK
jgi:OmpA-OmpF porin, OOP family